MKENWFALFLCIISTKEKSINKSIMQMGLRESAPNGKQKHPRKSKYSEEDFSSIFKLKQEGKSNSEVGQTVGLSRTQVYGLINRHRKEVKS